MSVHPVLIPYELYQSIENPEEEESCPRWGGKGLTSKGRVGKRIDEWSKYLQKNRCGLVFG